MSIKRLAGIVVLIFIFIIGCSGDYGKLKTQSENESKVTQRELIDNWSDYNIWLSYSKAPVRLIVFDPKNDDRKILVKGSWSKVKDQEMWQEIVKANTTSNGDFKLPGAGGTSRVQEIWGPDNQLYGFIIYQKYIVYWVNVKLVDDNTMRLSWQRPPAQGSPAR